MKLTALSDCSNESKIVPESCRKASPWLLKCTFSSADFELIKKVRLERQGLKDCVDLYDVDADHYLLIDQSARPIFVMRVNQARRGELDCERFYPKELLDNHRSVLCSASRFMRSRQFSANPVLAKRFLHLVREDQLLEGMIGDVINAHAPMLPYYKSIGYEALNGHDFIHPRLGTESKVMLLMANGHCLQW
jgi:hypothetical protein